MTSKRPNVDAIILVINNGGNKNFAVFDITKPPHSGGQTCALAWTTTGVQILSSYYANLADKSGPVIHDFPNIEQRLNGLNFNLNPGTRFDKNLMEDSWKFGTYNQLRPYAMLKGKTCTGDPRYLGNTLSSSGEHVFATWEEVTDFIQTEFKNTNS